MSSSYSSAKTTAWWKADCPTDQRFSHATSKTVAWWKRDTTDSKPSPLMSLPGELRNMIYEAIMADTERIVIDGGRIKPHPLMLVNAPIRHEFAFIFGKKCSTPSKVTLRIQNFDFEDSVKTLDRLSIVPSTRFEIESHITKQLDRDDWTKLWSWIEFCDNLMPPREHFSGSKIRSTHHVKLQLTSCNPYAAAYELYVEAMPYILKGAGGLHGVSAGYEEIAKIRAALRGAITEGYDVGS